MLLFKIVLVLSIAVLLLIWWVYNLYIKIKKLVNRIDSTDKNITSLQSNQNQLYSNQRALSDSIKKLYAEIYRGKKRQKSIKEKPVTGEDEGTGPV